MKLTSLIIFFIQLAYNVNGQSIGTLSDWEFESRENHSRIYSDSLIKLSEVRLSDYDLYDINHLEVDKQGNILFFDYSEHQIIYLPNGDINNLIRIGEGEGRGPQEFGNPFDSKFDSNGDIWIADVDRMEIQKWSASGQFLKSFITGKYVRPIKIAISDLGFLYVLSEQYGPEGVIYKYDGQGNLLSSFQTPKGQDFRSVLFFEGDLQTMGEELIFAGRIKPFLRKYSPDGRLQFSKGIVGFNNPTKILTHNKKWTSRNENLLRATIDIQVQIGRIYTGISNRVDRWIRIIDIYDESGEYLSSVELTKPSLRFAVFNNTLVVLEYNYGNDELYFSKYEIVNHAYGN